METKEAMIPTPDKVDIPDSSFPTTRAKTKAGESHLIPPLEHFYRRGARKDSNKRNPSRHLSTNSRKDAEGYPSDSQSSVESDSRTVTFPTRKWADYTSSSSSDTQMPVMVAEAATSDDRFQEMAIAIEKLTKSLEEKDSQIATLMTRLEVQQNVGETSQENQNPSGNKVTDIPDSQEKQRHEEHDRVEVQNAFRESANQTIASLSVQQLQQMIADSIRVQYGGSPQSSIVYAKPYTLRIDEIRMPLGYQPPKFQQFDGRGSPKQHVAHFIETCNNAGTYGDSMVKQFVRSLKGAAFDWYTDLPAGSIGSWDQLEREFLTRFYSTRRTVSIPELAQTKQRKDEPVMDYIERWRNLILNCKERISEASSIDMCVQGMHWGLLYSIKSNMPHSFEELATRAHDLEIQIARHGSHFPSESRNEGKKEVRKDGKPGKVKESMSVTTAPKKISVNKPMSKPREENKITTDQSRQKGKRSLKELEEKEYPFPDTEVSKILDQLLKEKLIELPTPKRPEEVRRTNDLKFCRYHPLENVLF